MDVQETTYGPGKNSMMNTIPEKLGLIAGRGAYPLLLAESAKMQGVGHVFAIAFRGETESRIERLADSVAWLRVGQLQAMLDALRENAVSGVVMAGQIAPGNLFNVRPDARMLGLLARLERWNAHTIFGAIGDELRDIGVELLPASRFMESAMPAPGTLGERNPTEAELSDIRLGLEVAKVVSSIEIGQTVVVKQGVILAVEAFEGTDETLLRAGRLGGPGAVVVKVAKRGHDMRFDIPVVGERTFQVLRRIKAGVLAVEAGKTILLERDKLIETANRRGLAFVATQVEHGNTE